MGQLQATIRLGYCRLVLYVRYKYQYTTQTGQTPSYLKQNHQFLSSIYFALMSVSLHITVHTQTGYHGRPQDISVIRNRIPSIGLEKPMKIRNQSFSPPLPQVSRIQRDEPPSTNQSDSESLSGEQYSYTDSNTQLASDFSKQSYS